MTQAVATNGNSADTLRVERLREAVSRGGGPKAVAVATGINQRTLYSYLRGETEIRLGDAARVAEFCDVGVDWLATGRNSGALETTTDERAVQISANRGYTVIGLASCGLKNWFQGDAMAVEAELRLEDPEAFAVMAVGESLHPEGVRQGFLCFCSPNSSRRPGDIVFAERADGTAALKRLVSESLEMIVMEGWLPPEGGQQDLYREEIKASYIRRIATVVYVKRKL